MKAKTNQVFYNIIAFTRKFKLVEAIIGLDHPNCLT